MWVLPDVGSTRSAYTGTYKKKIHVHLLCKPVTQTDAFAVSDEYLFIFLMNIK